MSRADRRRSRGSVGPLALGLVWGCFFSCSDPDPKSGPTPAPEPSGAGAGAERPEAWVDRLWARLGGKDAYDRIRGLRFTFEVEQGDHIYTSRTWLWDRERNRVRMDAGEGDGQITIQIDLATGRGVALVGGVRAEDPAEEEESVDYARDRFWSADSFWLLLPWKLRDPGVRLELLDDYEVEGRPHKVIEMTFEPGTGVTSGDRFHLFLDAESAELTRFAFHLQSMREDQEMSIFDWDEWVEVAGVRFSTERRMRVPPQRVLIRGLEALDVIDESLFGELESQ